jgi:hypothetical protein
VTDDRARGSGRFPPARAARVRDRDSTAKPLCRRRLATLDEIRAPTRARSRAARPDASGATMHRVFRARRPRADLRRARSARRCPGTARAGRERSSTKSGALDRRWLDERSAARTIVRLGRAARAVRAAADVGTPQRTGRRAADRFRATC